MERQTILPDGDNRPLSVEILGGCRENGVVTKDGVLEGVFKAGMNENNLFARLKISCERELRRF
jgi:hypothetical protein